MRDGAVTIRACTRQADALAHAEIRARLPLLAKALGFVGHVQTRNRGTIGGSLANADPSAEIGLACLALDCQIVARKDGGERVLSVGDFFLGPMETALKPEECLTEIRFPAWRERGRIGTGFKEISVRHSDFALVAVCSPACARRGWRLPPHSHQPSAARIATPSRRCRRRSAPCRDTA